MRMIRVLLSLFHALIRLISLLILALGLYSAADTVYLYREAAGASVLRFRPDPVSQSGDQVSPMPESAAGWLVLEGAGVDTPVMQGTDNLEYLNKNPYGEFSLSGSLFLDCRNAGDFSDSYSLIYGHHMEHHLMFGALDQYLDKEFFDSHSKGTLITESEIYDLEIFAVAECSAYEKTIFSPPDDSGLRSYIRASAIYLRPADMSGRILAMSTCQAMGSPARTVVFAMIREHDKGDDNEQSAVNISSGGHVYPQHAAAS